MRTGRLLILAPVATLAAFVAGCQSGGPRLAGLNPFFRPERTSYVTPAQRVAEVTQIADAATGEDTPEQRALVESLVRPLQDERDPLLRQARLEAIAEFSAVPLAGRALVAGLGDADAHVREACCRLLAESPAPGAAERLAALAREDDSFEVRVAAGRALGPVGATPQQILPLLEDGDPAIQLVGVEAMRRSTGEDLGRDVRAYVAVARGEEPPEKPAGRFAESARWLPFF